MAIKSLLLCFLMGCASTEKHHMPEVVVLKSTWAFCWKKCGKGDTLASVSNSACNCSNGGVVPLQPQIPMASEEPSFFSKLLDFFTAEAK